LSAESEQEQSGGYGCRDEQRTNDEGGTAFPLRFTGRILFFFKRRVGSGFPIDPAAPGATGHSGRHRCIAMRASSHYLFRLISQQIRCCQNRGSLIINSKIYIVRLRKNLEIFQKISHKTAVNESGVKKGLCVVYVPHTTAGVTINENADPSVQRDILMALSEAVPDSLSYSHAEGNSPGHIKSSLMGCSAQVLIENSQLQMGTWQGIFFCEFDGPRNRKCFISIMPRED